MAFRVTYSRGQGLPTVTRDFETEDQAQEFAQGLVTQAEEAGDPIAMMPTVTEV